MKGLLIKDVQLLKQNLILFLLMIVVGMIFLVSDITGGMYFTASYIIFMCAGLSTSTISYDLYENSMNYLLCLPVTKKMYVREKYVFSLICVGIGVTSLFLLNIIGYLWMDEAMQEIFSIQDYLVTVGLILSIAVFIMLIMLPIMLKFGGEKGRMVFVSLLVIAFMLISVARSVMESALLQAMWFVEANPKLILMVLGVVMVCLFFVSYYTSLHIVNRKQY